jgi:hypothetical protein
LDKPNYINFLTDTRKNVLATTVFILLFLLISPVFPGVKWFRLGDFTLYTVNFYHTIMIPLAFILILVATSVFSSVNWIKKAINLTTYPILIFSFLGLVLFYPPSAATVDEIMQAIRDILMVVDAIGLILLLLVFPFKAKTQFKSIYGGYALTLLATISATIAAIFGMLLEYGNLYGFASFGPINSYINSIGGLSTFLGNAWTLHSHQMLPAVMGGIVGLTAVVLGYNKLSKGMRNLVNIGMLISVFGVISMTAMYFIAAVGTWVIPAIFVSGAGGANGLALDDSQTGIIGIGAIIALFGLVKAVDVAKGRKYIQLSSLGTWVAAMATMVGVGYVIEFNEVYYGFGDPTQGAGALYDQAYTDGHLMFAFFFLVVVAGILLASFYLNKGDHKYFKLASYFAVGGMIIAFEGLLVYVMTLNWVTEAIGIVLLFISLAMATIPIASAEPPRPMVDTNKENSRTLPQGKF